MNARWKYTEDQVEYANDHDVWVESGFKDSLELCAFVSTNYNVVIFSWNQ